MIGWLTTRGIDPSGTAARVRGRSHLDKVCTLGSSKNQVLAVRSTRGEVGTFGSNGNEVRAVGSDLIEAWTARGRFGGDRGGPDGWISGGEVQRLGSEAGLRSVKGTTREEVWTVDPCQGEVWTIRSIQREI